MRWLTKIGGNLFGSPGKEMFEERKEEILKYATTKEAINIQGLKYLTMTSH